MPPRRVWPRLSDDTPPTRLNQTPVWAPVNTRWNFVTMALREHSWVSITLREPLRHTRLLTGGTMLPFFSASHRLLATWNKGWWGEDKDRVRREIFFFFFFYERLAPVTPSTPHQRNLSDSPGLGSGGKYTPRLYGKSWRLCLGAVIGFRIIIFPSKKKEEEFIWQLNTWF